MRGYLFVYGTLRPSLALSQLRKEIARWRVIGFARVPGRLFDLGLFPGAVVDPADESRIVGEVLELPDERETLEFLDLYEGYDAEDESNSQYLRRRCLAALENGGEIECWIYVYNVDTAGAEVIASGDYAEHLRQKYEYKS